MLDGGYDAGALNALDIGDRNTRIQLGVFPIALKDAAALWGTSNVSVRSFKQRTACCARLLAFNPAVLASQIRGPGGGQRDGGRQCSGRPLQTRSPWAHPCRAVGHLQRGYAKTRNALDQGGTELRCRFRAAL